MSQIVNAEIGQIDPNPCRLLKKYPYVESKLNALKRSMGGDIGCWEGIIARKNGDRYEIAFGHHRLKAASDLGFKEIPLIIRKLTDQQMLQFMGRENLDDYSASFLVLLETWEAAEKYCAQTCASKNEPLDVARLLGWTARSPESRGGQDMLTHTARACNAAHKLIHAGYIESTILTGITVNVAEQIVERAQSRMESIERLGEKTNRPPKEIERAKRQIAKGARETVKKVKEGKVAERDIRREVDFNAYRYAKESKQVSPLFEVFGKALAEEISRYLNQDRSAERLQAIVDALDKIELDTDFQIVNRVAFEVGSLSDRALRWHARLTKKPAPVAKFKLLSGE